MKRTRRAHGPSPHSTCSSCTSSPGPSSEEGWWEEGLIIQDIPSEAYLYRNGGWAALPAGPPWPPSSCHSIPQESQNDLGPSQRWVFYKPQWTLGLPSGLAGTVSSSLYPARFVPAVLCSCPVLPNVAGPLHPQMGSNRQGPRALLWLCPTFGWGCTPHPWDHGQPRIPLEIRQWLPIALWPGAVKTMAFPREEDLGRERECEPLGCKLAKSSRLRSTY